MKTVNPILAASFNSRREADRQRTELLKQQRAAKQSNKQGGKDFAEVLASALVGY